MLFVILMSHFFPTLNHCAGSWVILGHPCYEGTGKETGINFKQMKTA